MPNITDAVTIDGTTNPGFAGTPIVEINGAGAGDGAIGINIRISGNTIRGLVINRFSRDGIWMTNSFNTVVGCYIGTDVTGTVALANSYYTSGVHVALYVASNGNTIGGTAAADRNIIAGNASVGIRIDGNNNTIIGNYIGVDSTGETALGNGDVGILIAGGYSGNIIGGTAPGSCNVISGNATYGIDDMGPNTTIQGNYIGVSASGLRAIGNGSSGIYIESWSENNIIGGTADGAGNIIAYNGGSGVRAVSGHTDGAGNAILSNWIYSNTGLGIDLGGDGVTANDLGDADSGANHLQNFPELLGVATNGTRVNIQGTLNSTAGHTFRIEFFANDSPDSRGYGQGQYYLGSTEIPTDSAGIASFLTTLTTGVAAGKSISATVTDLTTNDTSEFAQVATAKAPAIIATNADNGAVLTSADKLRTSEDGASVQFNVALNAPPTSNVTITIHSSSSEGAVLPNSTTLIFTPLNWNVPQTVTVTGVMDYVTDGDAPYTVNLNRGACNDHIYDDLGMAAVSLLNIDHVNRAPVLTVPAKQTTNTYVIFSPAAQSEISIADTDAGTNPIQVRLTATNGLLTLGSTAGLNFLTGTGSGDSNLEFLGSVAAVNAALKGMTFAPSSSTGNLEITVNDQGNSGSGGDQSTTADIEIDTVNMRRSSTSQTKLAPPCLSPVVPLPPAPTPPAPPGNPTYTNPNFIHPAEQGVQALRDEPASEGKTLARSIVGMPLGNPRSGKNASFNAYADYLASHDRLQAIAIQPIVPKLNNSDYSLQSVIDMQLLLKEMKAVVAQSETLPWLSKINVGTAIGISAGLGAGYIVMAFRWGALITSGLATTFPLWQWIDPLPILESSKNKSDNQKDFGENEQNLDSQGNESLESIVS